MTKRQLEYQKEIREQVSKGKIKARLKELSDWRGEMLSHIRALMNQVDPKIIEEVKWIKPTNPLGTVVWSYDGLICTCEIYKNSVKMTFARGAELDDPSSLFNSSLDAKVWRAIDFHEGDKINERALKNLVRSAIALNIAALKKESPPSPDLKQRKDTYNSPAQKGKKKRGLKSLKL